MPPNVCRKQVFLEYLQVLLFNDCFYRPNRQLKVLYLILLDTGYLYNWLYIVIAVILSPCSTNLVLANIKSREYYTKPYVCSLCHIYDCINRHHHLGEIMCACGINDTSFLTKCIWYIINCFPFNANYLF